MAEVSVPALAKALARALGLEGAATIQISYDERGRVSSLESRKRWAPAALEMLPPARFGETNS